jgi:chemotaxis protein MotB
MIPIRVFAWTALCFTGCVLKGTHTDTVAQNIELSSHLTAVKKERDALKAKVDDLSKRASELEARNEELSDTNQRLVGKNADYARKSLEDQQEVLRLRQEKTQVEEKSEFVMKTYDDLVKTMKNEIAEGEIRISQQGERLSVDVSEQVLFLSGSDKVQPKGEKILKKLIPALKGAKDKRVTVEGHTDNAPIQKALRKVFPSNWELSAARAVRVVRFLEGQGVDPVRLSAVGYGEHRPIASNRDAEGKKRNRRIEIVLLPQAKPPA